MPGRKEIARRLHLADKICVGTVVAVYAATLFYLLATALLCGASFSAFLRLLLVPAASFIALSLVRKALNKPRPYDYPGFEPIMTPSKSGESFPSRHASSGSIIATALLTVCTPAAAVCYACTLALSIIRVKGGLHFTRDVVAGIVAGIILGSIAFIIPN